MKFSGTTFATAFSILPVVLVAGRGGDGAQPERRAASSSSSSTASESKSTRTSTPAASGAAKNTASFSLQSTNPTALPLSAINNAEPVASTRPLDHTATPGAKPTFIPNAPELPNAAALKYTDYPALDKTPPVDSDEVKQWIQEVKDSGIVIPNLTSTTLGGCANNSSILGDPDRCWWTCSGCTRSTDIVECPTAMDWGLTYDDGPSPYTSDLLAYLEEAKLKSTFFVVGSRVISYPEVLQAEYMAGHQVAVHTWSHASLTTLTNEQIIAELGWTKKVIKDVLGVTPNMMRPPSGDIDNRVRAISMAMGLTPVMWSRISATSTFDTDDFNIQSGTTTVQQVLQNWGNIISNATSRSTGFIVLEHDLFEQTVQVATGYILPDALAHQPPFKILPVISCLNKDMKEAYVETNDSEKNPLAISEAVSSGDVTLTGSAASALETSANGSATGSAASAEQSSASTSAATSVRFAISGWLPLAVTAFIGMTVSRLLSVSF